MQNINTPSKNSHPEIVTSQKAREEPTPVLASRQHIDSPATNLPQCDAQSPEKEFSKREMRKQKKQALKSAALEAKCESGGHQIAAPQAGAIASRTPSAPTDVRSTPQVPSSERASSGSDQTSSSSSNRVISMAVTVPSSPPANDSARNHGPLAMKAGMTTQGVSLCLMRGSPRVNSKSVSREISFYRSGRLNRNWDSSMSLV